MSFPIMQKNKNAKNNIIDKKCLLLNYIFRRVIMHT